MTPGYSELKLLGIKDDSILNLFRLTPDPFRLKNVLLVGSGDEPTLRNGHGQFERADLSRIPHKVSGVVLKIDPMTAVDFPGMVENISNQLGPEKGIWILERAVLNEEGKKARELALEQFGLVERKVVTTRGGYALWYGRTEKTRVRRGVDLTQKSWFMEKVRKTIEDLRKAGWEVVDLSEAIEHCRDSRFPPLDLGNLELGFGARLKAPCGCWWNVNRNGEWNRDLANHCADPECPGEPVRPTKEERKPVKKEKTTIRKSPACWDCGRSMKWDPNKKTWFCGKH